MNAWRWPDRLTSIPEGAPALVLHLARRTPGPVNPALLHELANAEALTEFNTTATRHGLLGLVLNSLCSSPLFEQLPPASARSVLAQLATLRRQAALWDLARDRALDLLDHAGIEPLVLKGGALRAYIYREPFERPAGDLDLLVQPAQLDPALAQLTRGGFALRSSDRRNRLMLEHHFHFELAGRNGYSLELHWALTRPAAAICLDPAGFIARSRLVDARSRMLRVPATEDMLIHLCTQNIEDGFSRLRRLVDIDRLVARFPPDWDAVATMARAGGAEIVVGLSLQLARRLLGTEIPAGLIEGLVRGRATRYHLALLRPAEGMLSGSGQRYHVGFLTLSCWLITPRRRLSQLRTILRNQLEPEMAAEGRTGGRAPWATALRLGVFEALLLSWALRDRLHLRNRAGADLWGDQGPEF